MSIRTDIAIRSIRSFKWTMLAEFVSRVTQPLTLLALARLLSPREFGVIGVASIAIGLAERFQDFGLGKALIKQETDVEEAASIVFAVTTIFSLVLFTIIWIGAPAIGQFFSEPATVPVLRILCFTILLNGMTTVHQSILQRQFDFHRLFYVRLVSSLSPPLLSIPMAINGYGVWALVAGILVSSVLRAVSYCVFLKLHPSLRWRVSLVKGLLGFSSWVFLELLFGWILAWGDSIALVKILSVSDVGIYRVATKVTETVFVILVYNTAAIQYSAFARMATLSDMALSFVAIGRVYNFVCMFAGVCTMAGATLLQAIVGDKWPGLGVVVSALAVKEMFSGLLMGMGPEIYRAAGRPWIHPTIMVLASLFYIPSYFLFAHWGLVPFAWVRTTLTIVIGNGLHFYFLRRVLGLDWRRLLQMSWRSTAAGLLVLCPLYIYSVKLTSSIALSMCVLAVTVVTYVGLALCFDSSLYPKLTSYIAFALRRGQR